MAFARNRRNRLIVPLDGTEVQGYLGAVTSLAPRGSRTELVALGIVEESGVAGRDAREARALRRRLHEVCEKAGRPETRVVVQTATSVADGVRDAVRTLRGDILALPWPAASQSSGELANSPPCDTVFIRPTRTTSWRRVLVAARGGPYAKLAFELALAISTNRSARVTLLHIDRPSTEQESRRREDELFEELSTGDGERALVQVKRITTEDVAGAISDAATGHQLVVLGAGITASSEQPALGAVPEAVAERCSGAVLVVKTGEPVDPAFFSGLRPPLDVIVDRWFAQNTFHCREFSDIAGLVEAKKRTKATVSLAIMARGDTASLPRVAETLRAQLQERYALLDEIAIFPVDPEGPAIESLGAGLRVYKARADGNGRGPEEGPGSVLQQSIRLLSGDIIAWLDSDVRNVHPRMVYGVIGPLLTQEHIQYVKGFYERPLARGRAFTEGRLQTTELTARPLLNLFFAELSGVVEPLCREHAARRRAIERLPIFAGQGVEVGLLIDVLEQYGLHAIAQSDLESRVGREVGVGYATRKAFSVIQVIMKRLGERHGVDLLSVAHPSMKMILQQAEQYHLEMVEAGEPELAPARERV
jgi:glucosyl-3-phosphoglycerate synthase